MVGTVLLGFTTSTEAVGYSGLCHAVMSFHSDRYQQWKPLLCLNNQAWTTGVRFGWWYRQNQVLLCICLRSCPWKPFSSALVRISSSDEREKWRKTTEENQPFPANPCGSGWGDFFYLNWIVQGREVDQTSIVAFSTHLNWPGIENSRVTEI